MASPTRRRAKRPRSITPPRRPSFVSRRASTRPNKASIPTSAISSSTSSRSRLAPVETRNRNRNRKLIPIRIRILILNLNRNTNSSNLDSRFTTVFNMSLHLLFTRIELEESLQDHRHNHVELVELAAVNNNSNKAQLQQVRLKQLRLHVGQLQLVQLQPDQLQASRW